MTAAGVYASRFGRVLLADPTREAEVFTAARARGEDAPRPSAYTAVINWLVVTATGGPFGALRLYGAPGRGISDRLHQSPKGTAPTVLHTPRSPAELLRSPT